jgi:hypothetical protein
VVDVGSPAPDFELQSDTGETCGPEGEIGFTEQLVGDEALTGERLAVADVDRFYTCTVCGARGQLPPEDELRS